jgi:ssDNA-binding Zn-finger/Zn-ribbon topoisomerase 1
MPAYTCPLCGSALVRRPGPHGSFLGCARYPACKGTRELDGTSRWEAPAAPAVRPAALRQDQPLPPPYPAAVPVIPSVIVLPPERPPKDAGKDPFKLWKRVAAPVLVLVLVAVFVPKRGGGGHADQPPKPPQPDAATPAAKPADLPPPKAPPAQEAAAKVCPKCGAPMKVKNGKFGKFWSCTRFPDCRGSMDYP